MLKHLCLKREFSENGNAFISINNCDAPVSHNILIGYLKGIQNHQIQTALGSVDLQLVFSIMDV